MENKKLCLMKWAIIVSCAFVLLDAVSLIGRGVASAINKDTTLATWQIVLGVIVAMIAIVVLVYGLKVGNKFYNSEKGKNLYTIFTTTILVVAILFMLISLATLVEAIELVFVFGIVISALEVATCLASIALAVILFINRKDATSETHNDQPTE